MTTHSLPGWLRPTGFAFLYWLVFLLALEPGNILHAQRMGRSLDFELEVLRMTVAALLGCSTAPLLIGLVRRFPFTGERARRNMAAHLTIAAPLSVVLIMISCVLAAWVLQGQANPKKDDVRTQLAANRLLMTIEL